MNQEPRQLYFNLDGEIQEPEKEDSIKKHPFNEELSLSYFKEIFLRDSQYEEISLLLDSPINIEAEEIFKKEILKEALVYGELINQIERLKETKPKLRVINNFTGDLEAIDRNEYNFKYFVNYYFIDPLETKEEKLAYIRNMTKLEYPKKFIFDLWSKQVIAKDKKLNFIDKEALSLGFKEAEAWELVYNPYLEKYFNVSGIQEIKKIYDSLPKMTRDEIKESQAKENKDKFKEFNFLYHFIFNEPLKIAYNNYEIIDYKTYLDYKIALNEETYKNNSIATKELEEDINKTLTKLNKTMEDLEAYISAKENKPFKDIFKRDKSRYNYLNNNLYDLYEEEEYKEDLAYMEALRNSPEDSLERAYLNIIRKDSIYLNGIFLPSQRIAKYKLSIEAINEPNTWENYFNQMAKKLLAKELFYRDNESKETLIMQARGNIKVYSNNVIEGLKYTIPSFKKLEGAKLEEYKKIKESIAFLQSEINKIKTSINPDLDFEERENLEAQIEEYKKEIDSLYSMLKDKRYITINNNPFSVNITSANKDSIEIEETPNSFIIKTPSFKIINHKSFTILTKKNNKEHNQEASLEDLTTNLATRIQTLISIIIDKACNAIDNKLVFKTSDILLQLGYNTSSTAIKRGIADLKYMLTYLQDQKIATILLKGAYNKETKKKDSKYIDSQASLSFITSYVIDGDKLLITYESLFTQELYKYNKSKYWKPEILNYSTPEQRLLNERALSLNNQTRINSSGELKPRNISLRALISSIASYNDKLDDPKHYDRNIANPLLTDLGDLNKLADNPLTYEFNPFEIRTIRSESDLDSRTIEIAYRDGKTPQKFKNRAEEIKLNKDLKKKKKGSKK